MLKYKVIIASDRLSRPKPSQNDRQTTDVFAGNGEFKNDQASSRYAWTRARSQQTYPQAIWHRGAQWWRFEMGPFRNDANEYKSTS